MKIRLTALAICCALLLAACGHNGKNDGSAEASTAEFFAMDTYMAVKAWGVSEEVLQGAEDAVLELEGRISTTASGSEIHELNEKGSAEISKDTLELLEFALEMCEETDGALDISVYPVVRAWGFTADEYRRPPQEEIDALLERVDYTRLELELPGGSAEEDAGDKSAEGDPGSESSGPAATARLPEGMAVDLGSVGKGRAGDLMISILKDAGCESALLDLGGNIQTLGAKPDGSLWKIGIQDPMGDDIIGALSLSDKAVITSGGYERYFVDEDGELWWHIIDPSTGYPARSGLISATAVGENGAYCDALSTALFIMGPDRAVEFWRERGDFEMLLVRDDRRVLLSPGLRDCFEPGDKSSYSVEIIDE